MKVTLGLLIGAMSMLALSRMGTLIGADINRATNSVPYLLRTCHDGNGWMLFKSKSGQYSLTTGEGKEYLISQDADIPNEICAP